MASTGARPTLWRRPLSGQKPRPGGPVAQRTLMSLTATDPEPPADTRVAASVEGLLAGRAAWAGRDGDLILTLEASLLPKVIRRRMSVSTAQSIESCPARWAVTSVLPRLEDPFGAAELGIATHQVFEDLFRLPAVERTIDAARDVVAGLAEAHPDLQVPPAGDVDARKRWREEIDRRMVGLWQIEDPAEVDVVATEQRIKVEVAGIPVVAVIDRVDRNWDQMKVKLIDFKAGLAKPPKLFFGDHHGEQLRLYALAWAAHTGGPLPAAAQVYYVAHGKARKVGLTRSNLFEAADGVARAWERMQAFSETAAFPTRASALCGWCPLAQVCPAAAAAGRAEPRSPEALIGPVLGVAGLPQPVIAAGGAPAAESSRAEPNRRPLDEQDDRTGPKSGRPIERGSSMRHEDKPWVEEIEGRLNFSSYAAGAVFGLTELAVETLHQAGVALTGQSVYALAETFATVIANVQRVMDAKVNMAEGLHTRLRGALRTSLVTLPAPFGADQEAWAAWVAATERRLRAIVTVAERLWQAERHEPGQPWAALAGATAEPIESAA